MKITNDTNITGYDPSGNLAPWMWYGSGAPAAAVPFTDAPVLSTYLDVVNGVEYRKTSNNKAAADWKATITTGGGQTISGDLTVTGTVTGGDLVATNA